MLKSCLGLPLRTGTSIIAIGNAIESVCYIIFNVWQHFIFSKQLNESYESYRPYSHSNPEVQIDVMLNAVTVTFIITGCTWLFASCGLQHATFKNATDKIYLWLLVAYVQLGTAVMIELAMLIRYSISAVDLIGFVVCFLLIDAFIAYQILVVHSFYAEEKLNEQNNYSQLVSRLSTLQVDEIDDEELQQVDLN